MQRYKNAFLISFELTDGGKENDPMAGIRLRNMLQVETDGFLMGFDLIRNLFQG